MLTETYTQTDYQAEARSYRWFGWKSPTFDELESIRKANPTEIPVSPQRNYINTAPKPNEVREYIHSRWDSYLGPLNPRTREIRKAVTELNIVV